MKQCRIIYCSLAALRVSRDSFAHHLEHLNCIYSLWYFTRELLPAGFMGELELTIISSNSPMKRPRNNKLSYTVASCCSFSYIISWCRVPWISSL